MSGLIEVKAHVFGYIWLVVNPPMCGLDIGVLL